MVSTPEAREATSGTAGETVEVGTAELASAPRLVANEGVLTDSLGEKMGAVLGTVGLVSAGWVAEEAVVYGSPGEAVTVGRAELASIPEWATHVAVGSS